MQRPFASGIRQNPPYRSRCRIIVKKDVNEINMEQMSQKKRAVVSYENMSEELAAAFAEKYPKGFSDYLPDLLKYDKPDGTSFYAVTVEIPSAIYLVKIKVKTDDAEDIERWLDGEDDEDSVAESGPDSGDLPDDNIAQYASSDDDVQESDMD